MGTNYDKWAQIEKDLPEDEEDQARARLRQQKENMSEKEVRRLHECWEQPEFRQMWDEYQQEVSDPAHRAETEEYLAQVEAEQRAGKAAAPPPAGLQVESLSGAVPGMPDQTQAPPSAPEGSELLKPNKGFVLKTFERQAGHSDFDREMGKVFINVCSHGAPVIRARSLAGPLLPQPRLTSVRPLSSCHAPPQTTSTSRRPPR